MEQAYIKDNSTNEWLGITSTFGALLIRGAYEALLTPPPMKDYIVADSRLRHGSEYLVNTQTAMKKQRELTIYFFIEGSSVEDYLWKYEYFLDTIAKGVIQFKVPRLGRIYKLVYTSCSKYGNYGEKRGKFALKFIEPDPTDREVIE